MKPHKILLTDESLMVKKGLATTSDEFIGRVTSFETVQTSSGSVKVPWLYREVVYMAAFFPASIKQVREILPSNRLKPVNIGGGRTIYGFGAFEYREASVGSYNEVAMAVAYLYDPFVNLPYLPALFDNAFQVGFYIHHLPVTTKIAYDGGLEIWGLPKFIADISFEESDDRRRCTLEDHGKRILTLEVQKGKGPKPDVRDFRAFSVKDKMILKTIANVKGLLRTSSKAESASFTLGDHTVSEELRSLNIGQKPLRTLYYPKAQIILNAPKEKFPFQEEIAVRAK